MHIPKAEGRIISLKVLDQKGYESRITGRHIHIMRNRKTCAKAFLGRQLYEVKMKIVPLQEIVKDKPLGSELPTQESRNTVLRVSALHYSTKHVVAREWFGRWLQFVHCA